MRHLTWLLTLVAIVFCVTSGAQNSAEPTTKELLRILRITTFRVRVPAQPHYVWDIKVIKPSDVKGRGTHPRGLTVNQGLLSFRDKGNDIYEFTLPERNGAFSQGDFELCKEVTCAGQYSVNWLKQPVYSADGTQCLFGEFSNLGDDSPTGYIALVRVHNTPDGE